MSSVKTMCQEQAYVCMMQFCLICSDKESIVTGVSGKTTEIGTSRIINDMSRVRQQISIKP